MIAASSLPEPTTRIEKDLSLSNKTALSIIWDKVEDSSLPITGYIL